MFQEKNFTKCFLPNCFCKWEWAALHHHEMRWENQEKRSKKNANNQKYKDINTGIPTNDKFKIFQKKTTANYNRLNAKI
ncbi:hypothetical protein DERF_013557 [Dermatophagoides farinae]|uniref:Uncharacterized protein n=1 Tax=Dermatophagoides farinae TaxID=6954 RepID=A0A922KVG8_DERFA|nr:hypothetical protein DERF_013557 [Dermatophagoides farinae]